MKHIAAVTSWIDSPRVNNFPDFSPVQRYRGDDPQFSLPSKALNQILEHLRIDDYYDTIILTGFVSSSSIYIPHITDTLDTNTTIEEIWDAHDYIEPDSKKVIDYNLSIDGFSWGRASLGIIRINDSAGGYVRIPVYWTQNASPLGFVMSASHRKLLTDRCINV